MGIVRALRDIFRQTRTFGDKELSQIRAAAKDLKSQVEYLKEARQKSREQKEALALRELRRAVEALQLERDTIKQQAVAVEAAFEELSEDVKQQLSAEQEQKLEAHMAQVLEAVDLDKFLGGAELEEAVRLGHQLPEKLRGAFEKSAPE